MAVSTDDFVTYFLEEHGTGKGQQALVNVVSAMLAQTWKRSAETTKGRKPTAQDLVPIVDEAIAQWTEFSSRVNAVVPNAARDDAMVRYLKSKSPGLLKAWELDRNGLLIKVIVDKGRAVPVTVPVTPIREQGPRVKDILIQIDFGSPGVKEACAAENIDPAPLGLVECTLGRARTRTFSIK